jgi:hypothetical protein
MAFISAATVVTRAPKRAVSTGRRRKRSKREPIFTPRGNRYLLALAFAVGVGFGLYFAAAFFSTILIGLACYRSRCSRACVRQAERLASVSVSWRREKVVPWHKVRCSTVRHDRRNTLS